MLLTFYFLLDLLFECYHTIIIIIIVMIIMNFRPQLANFFPKHVRIFGQSLQMCLPMGGKKKLCCSPKKLHIFQKKKVAAVILLFAQYKKSHTLHQWEKIHSCWSIKRQLCETPQTKFQPRAKDFTMCHFLASQMKTTNNLQKKAKKNSKI